MASSAISLTEVSKVYGRGPGAVLAVDRVSLTVAPGEFVCLVGASGCGKSTLLSLASSLEEVTAGTLSVSGRTALMFQEAALFPWLTTSENVEIALRLRGVNKRDRRQRAAELLEVVHLSDFAAKRPHELSGGMRARVALARTLAAIDGDDGAVLLMDEPFGALDALTRRNLQDELLRIWAELKKTIIFVTHSIEEAIYLADRILVMTNGPAASIGEVVEVTLPRPRDKRALVHTTEYADLKDHLLYLLTNAYAPEAVA